MRDLTRWLVRSVAVAGIPAVVAMSCIEPTGPSLRLTEPRVVFASNRDGNDEIYSMNSDGTNVTRLTNNGARDVRPVWHPDGRFIAFISERSGNRDVWIMNPDGTGLRNLTADPSIDDNAAWSTDGSRIVFSSNRLGNHELFVVDADGSNATNPQRLTDHFAFDTWPSFSPDGRFIAFQADRNSVNDDIYVLFNTTNEIFRLTSAGGADQHPAWSPDGTKVAFTSVRDGNQEIYTLDFTFFPVQAPNQVNITNDPATDARPAWSNNGRQLCFVSNRAGNNDIWLMGADGSTPVRLTTSDANDFDCSIK